MRFQDLPTSTRHALENSLSLDAHTHVFHKGDNLVYKGQIISGAYWVREGELRIYTLDSQGNEKPIYQLYGGELCLFSINSVLNQQAYPAWVTVDSESVELVSIPDKAFKQLYDEDKGMRDYVLASLSARILDLMSAIEANAVYDIGDRINSFLVRACPADGVLTLSHQDIAHRLGTAREVVSRHLKQLEKQGLLSLSRMRITIHDTKALGLPAVLSQ